MIHSRVMIGRRMSDSARQASCSLNGIIKAFMFGQGEKDFIYE